MAVRNWGMSSGGLDTKSAKFGPLARRSLRLESVRRGGSLAEAAEANARQAWNETHGWESAERWRQRGPIDLKDIWGQEWRVNNSMFSRRG